MKYNPQEQQLITSAFASLNARNIRYVVLRWADALPAETPGGDIDVLVDSEHLDAAEECLRTLGFSRNKLDRLGGARSKWNYYKAQLAEIVTKPATVPRRAVRFGANQVRRVVSLFKGGKAKPKGKSERAFRDVKVYKSNIMIHMVNHLAYSSTLNRKKIMTDQRVVESMLSGRRIQDGPATPAPVDELVHLVCRGVFDRFGEFTDYYVRRCEALYADVRGIEEDMAKLRDLLDTVFFKAGSVVLRGIASSEYGQLREQLRRFSGY